MGKVKKCGTCKGTGKVWKQPIWYTDAPIHIICPKCYGKGIKQC